MDADLVIGTSENLFNTICYRWPKRKRTGADLIAHYTHAVEPNVLCWLALTYPWLHHEAAQMICKFRLRCEQKENYRATLLAFARECGALPSGLYHALDAQILGIHQLFEDTENAGLVGLTIRIILDHLAPTIIADLKKASRLCGNNSRHWKYLHVCGKQSEVGANALKSAFDAERHCKYENPDRIIGQTMTQTINVLQQVFLMPAPLAAPVKQLQQTHGTLH
jgi:hypothetical protein